MSEPSLHSRAPVIVLSCEHAGNNVPAEYATLFLGAGDALASHRGWDPGAYETAQLLAEALGAQLLACHATRLLVDTNRSLDNPTLFSEFVSSLTPERRQRVIDEHYTPHRSEVESHVASIAASGALVVHIGVHSFVDVLHGAQREVDLGVLFDPHRASAASLCGAWITALTARLPEWSVRANEPYHGCDDGLTTHLRKMHDADRYIGVEIELNQSLIAKKKGQRDAADALAESLRAALPVITGQRIA